jgi:nondiscriminating glutamyl-tRNA synthetase
MTVRVRFAPSPTGHLHVGNARTALFNWLFAKKSGGTFVLRIEDTDLVRSEGRFEEAIFEDLRWLGMEWDEGPDIGGGWGPYRQSDRINLYQEKARELITLKRAYYCFCSEEELASEAEKASLAGIPWKYPGTCRSLSESEVKAALEAGRPSVIRLEVRPGQVLFTDIVHAEMEFSSHVISDPILIRSNGLPTYNYAVVVDDGLMQITHVIRGDDHLSNTPKQVLIYEALGWPLPNFAHLSTILGNDHTRLSKRHGAASIQNFQEMGILPEAMVNYLVLLGWAPAEGRSEILPHEGLIQQFDLQRVSKSAAVFDLDKLYWINRHYLKECDKDRLITLATHFLQKEGLVGAVDASIRAWVGQLVDALLSSINHLSEIPAKAVTITQFDAAKALRDEEVKQLLLEEGAIHVVKEFWYEISQANRNITTDWKGIIGALKARTNRKGKQLFHPIRVALTGSVSGPELDKLISIFEQGSRLQLPKKIKSCRERVSEFVAATQSMS